MSLTFVLSALAAISLLGSGVQAQDTTDTCVSYGVDIQNGGSYFQNISSTADFTFTSIFEGCQNDTADNILVDPNGDEYQCSDTPLLPNDTAQSADCPIQKDNMFSGDWSVLIISNNGDADPIAYERDFYLSVGVPSTFTFTPTVTNIVTSTPIVNSTKTSTETDTITTTKTVVKPAVTSTPTYTTTPKKVTSTKTVTVATISKTKYIVSPTLIFVTHTATCKVPSRQSHPDPTCSITPTLVTAAALQTSTSNKFRAIKDRAVPLDRAQRIAERKARLFEARGIQKRTLDNATTTVTDTNTLDYATITSTSTAPASTVTVVAVKTVSKTSTTTTTTYSGTTTVRPITKTAPTPTKTKTKYTVFTTTVSTHTRTQSITITKTYVPAASQFACAAKGGKMR